MSDDDHCYAQYEWRGNENRLAEPERWRVDSMQ
jgi:hypothetical protein